MGPSSPIYFRAADQTPSKMTTFIEDWKLWEEPKKRRKGRNEPVKGKGTTKHKFKGHKKAI